MEASTKLEARNRVEYRNWEFTAWALWVKKYCMNDIIRWTHSFPYDNYRVTLTIRKIEQEILAAGHCVCILTTTSGDPVNTHLDGQHPNRSVLFLDNSVEIPFINDPTTPALSYHVGFSLSNKVKQEIEVFEPSIIHITCPDVTCLHLIQYARNKELPLMGTYHSNIPEYMEHYPGIGWVKFALGAFFRHEYNFLQHLYVPTPYIRQHLVESWNLHQVL